jgi:DNA-binding NarL/FixJ family response regulator
MAMATRIDWAESIVKEQRVDSSSGLLSALLVDHDEAWQAKLGRTLVAHGIVLHVAANVSRARRFLQSANHPVDVVLINPVLSDGRGEDLLAEIEALPRQPGVVILTSCADEKRWEAASYRAIWVPKGAEPEALARIMRRAARGYAQDTLYRFARRFRLTRKEARVLDGIASGVGPKQIALSLGCSAQAIYALLAKVSTKTKCSSYQEVVAKLFLFSCHGLGHAAWNLPSCDAAATPAKSPDDSAVVVPEETPALSPQP